MPMLTEQSVPAIAAMLGVAGPVLTVKSVRDGWVICTWWNGDYGEFQSGLSDRTSDGRNPEIERSVVVFPAPLVPTSATIDPAAASSDTP
jgi:hypothetical protein